MSSANRKSSIYDPEQIFENGRDITFLESIINFAKKTCGYLFPIIDTAVNCHPDHYKQLRQLVSFIIGSIYGFLIYYFTIYQIEGLTESLNAVLFSFILLTVSIGMTFNESVRCLMTLSTFNFLSSAGKVILTGYIITNLLNGPIDNTFSNLVSLTNSFKCQIELTKNFSDQMKSKPQKETDSGRIILDSQTEMNELNEDIADMIEATEEFTSAETDDSLSNFFIIIIF